VNRGVSGEEGVKDYHINIFYSEEDGGYIADIPDLDACSAFGETADQALAEVERARSAWIAAAQAAGKPVPEPRYRPVIYQAR
jgi:predicted RNase H-like HicB family nuclease